MSVLFSCMFQKDLGMSVSFRILPRRGLVYVQYEGVAKVADTFAAFGEYMAHPDCRPGQKQLVDLRQLTAFERNYPELMALQARKADLFTVQGIETLIVYLVSSEETKSLTRMILQTWEAFDGIVPLIQTEEADALQLLGQPERSIAAMLALDATRQRKRDA